MESVVKESSPNVGRRRKRSKYSDAKDKVCEVCGDAAKSMHFGGMACDSCKAFFRRSVQSDTFKTFQCGAGKKTCPVVKDNRRICQYCRFQKCLSAGMEVKWVMSEADRMNLWKSKMSKQKQKKVQICTSSAGNNESIASSVSDDLAHPICTSPSVALNPADQDAIDHLVLLQELAFQSMPYPEDCQGDNPTAMANLFFCICQKIRTFFYRVEDFRVISKEDQTLALRNGIAMSIYLHGAYNYDVENQRWPALNINDALRLPDVSIETLRIFTLYPETYQTLMNFYNEYGNDLKDEVILVLLCLITLFHDSDSGLTARAYIQNVNNRYICLLRSYLHYTTGRQSGDEQLSRLLNSLFYVKKITSYHGLVDIRPTVDANRLISLGSISMADQIAVVTQLLNQALISDIPKYSSALSPDDKMNLALDSRNKQLTFRRPQTLPDPTTDLRFHHPITNIVFGADIRTDQLLSFAHKNILCLKAGVRKLRALDGIEKCEQSTSDITKSKNTRNCKDSHHLEKNMRLNHNSKYIKKYEFGQYELVNEPLETYIVKTKGTHLQNDQINLSHASVIKPYGFPFAGIDHSIPSENIY